MQSNVHLLSSPELIDAIQYLLDKDEKNILKKQEYYRQLYSSKSANPQQIKKIFDQIKEDEIRLTHFTELIDRLQTSHVLTIIEAIDNLKTEQRKINGKPLTDYNLYISRKNNEDQVFLDPLPTTKC